MWKTACVLLCLGLTGCSIALGSGAKRRPLIAADTVIAAGLATGAAVALSMHCAPQAWSCDNGTIGGLAIVGATGFAISALAGLTQPDVQRETRARDLTAHAMVAAHAGRCSEAADHAKKLKALDRDAYESLLFDDAIHGCLR
jgi:hypothetical protein